MTTLSGFLPVQRRQTACFSVIATAVPGTMPRVLEIFAKRGLVPARWPSAAALGKPVITLHDPDLTHPLKEIDGAALAVAQTPEQVVKLLAYVIDGTM